MGASLGRKPGTNRNHLPPALIETLRLIRPVRSHLSVRSDGYGRPASIDSKELQQDNPAESGKVLQNSQPPRNQKGKKPDRFCETSHRSHRHCRKTGVRIKLQEQPFQILAMLLERPGQIVTREELQKRLWPQDTFVDFDLSLNSAVKKLRQALGDDSENPRFIETLYRRGYRFLAQANGTASLSSAFARADNGVRAQSPTEERPLSDSLLPLSYFSHEDTNNLHQCDKVMTTAATYSA
ncbi:MAG TPA: helix-turn-helix domain-containing protein [Terriglobales bacterium]